MTDYLLGYDEQELARLEAQHAVWAPALLGCLRRHGLHAGALVLDAGCGTGALLRDLADAVGPGGRAVGIERDRASVELARTGVADRPWAEVRQGDLLTDDLGGRYELVVSRWVFSFLHDPGAALLRLRDVLRPDGILVIQDYQHDGIRLFPEHPAVHRVIEAFRAAYRRTGGDLYVAGRLPQLMAAAGMDVVEVDPVVKAGGPGSPPFDWVERFLHEHVGTLVEAGLLTKAEEGEFRDAWQAARAVPGCTLYTPIVASVVARR